LTAFVVQPLADRWVKRRLMRPSYARLDATDGLNERAQRELQSLQIRCFVWADVLVMGIAG